MDHQALIERIRDAIGKSGDGIVALCLVRLDRVAQINELIGYECAGLLLDEFQDRLRTMVRARDTLIAMDRHKLIMVMRGLSNEQHLALA
ncbi:MAG: diguanylate cyclase, partial [Gammaproteobacteria bacterium]|nr:diguanylate cyclase [Gammaproteobacteria bacterium]